MFLSKKIVIQLWTLYSKLSVFVHHFMIPYRINDSLLTISKTTGVDSAAAFFPVESIVGFIAFSWPCSLILDCLSASLSSLSLFVISLWSCFCRFLEASLSLLLGVPEAGDWGGVTGTSLTGCYGDTRYPTGRKKQVHLNFYVALVSFDFTVLITYLFIYSLHL